MKSIVDFWKQYKSKRKPKVSNTRYRLIINAYNKFLIDLVNEGEVITLPERLGHLRILGREQKVQIDENGNIKGLAPNWKATKDLWASNEEAAKIKKLVYHLNNETDNIRYKYFWSVKNVLVKNKTMYYLRMSRANKRYASKLFKSGKKFLIIE